MYTLPAKSIGISAIAAHQPAWRLSNDWFQDVPRKFVQHTGIQTRSISQRDEVSMAARAVENLVSQTGCDLRDCSGIVFASPSFVPLSVARRYFNPDRVMRERLRRAARRVAVTLGIPQTPVAGINWFCSGYSRAMEIVQRSVDRSLKLRPDQFVLVVTSSRISRITDYANAQTAPLFGDMATATLISRCDSAKYPVHFRLALSFAEKAPAAGVFFDYELRRNVPVPLHCGGRTTAPKRVVFKLEGMGIADAAPRAMSNAVEEALRIGGRSAEEVRYVVPHQAGTGIVRMTQMKLEQQLGLRCEVVNGLTSQVGNVSCCSIPYALMQTWPRLSGLIACPTAAVGNPGKAEVSQGCVLLESTRRHDLAATA